MCAAQAGALWCDAFQPGSLEELTFHPELSTLLKKLSTAGEFPHLLFYGASGSGKQTRIRALLTELFGPGVQRFRTAKKEYKVSATKKIELCTLSSPYHVEMNPGDAKRYDRVIVQEVIKDMASVHSMNVKNKRKFKVVVLHEVDQLTKPAQHALRRTMEKYMENCRIILCCESVSRIIDPLRSRCLSIRVPAPTHTAIVKTLCDVAQQEQFLLSESVAIKISRKSKRNLRRALLMLQVAHMDTGGNIEADTPIKSYPWEVFIDNICNEITREQRPAVLNAARNKLYELVVNCVPPTIIMRRLTSRIMHNTDDSLKAKIAYWAAFHEERMQHSSKKIPQIVAFIARVMYEISEWSAAMFA